jgi:hypothetical protein
MILSYVKNKHAYTLEPEDNTLMVYATSEETVFAARAEIKVKLPDLEVVEIQGEIRRSPFARCQKVVSLLPQTAGLRVGPGIIKLVHGLIGGSKGCPQMANLVMEGIDAVILHFTTEPLKEILKKEGEKQIIAYQEFLRQNPRLFNSCVAFAPDSPLAKGIKEEL